MTKTRSQAAPVLEVPDLRTAFRASNGWLAAVDGVSFSLQRGRTLAIVGEFGSGKSALARSIMGLYREGPNLRRTGSIQLDGKEIANLNDREMRSIRGRRIAMIFQDPMSSLNPVKKIGPQITEIISGHDRRTAKNKAIELLTLVGITAPEHRMNQYPMHFSGGMRQRVAIAIALAGKPEVLIADEPTTALDVTIQAQILELLFRLKKEQQMSLLLISHNLALVAGHSDHTMVMYAGRAVEFGPTRTVIVSPRMPYTDALMRAAPDLNRPPHTRLLAIPGNIPNMAAPPPGCRFEPRCSRAQLACKTLLPELEFSEAEHGAACLYPLDVKSSR